MRTLSVPECSPYTRRCYLYLTMAEVVFFPTGDTPEEQHKNARLLAHILTQQFDAKFAKSEADQQGNKCLKATINGVRIKITDAEYCEVEIVPGSETITYEYRCKQ